jgi:hypothetical protein
MSRKAGFPSTVVTVKLMVLSKWARALIVTVPSFVITTLSPFLEMESTLPRELRRAPP